MALYTKVGQEKVGYNKITVLVLSIGDFNFRLQVAF